MSHHCHTNLADPWHVHSCSPGTFSEHDRGDKSLSDSFYPLFFSFILSTLEWARDSSRVWGQMGNKTKPLFSRSSETYISDKCAITNYWGNDGCLCKELQGSSVQFSVGNRRHQVVFHLREIFITILQLRKLWFLHSFLKIARSVQDKNGLAFRPKP